MSLLFSEEKQPSDSFPFFRLPPELQRQVCQTLCQHCCDASTFQLLYTEDAISVQTLAALSASCKTLQDITQPILYHVPTAIKSYSSFLKTLFDRPDLAANVKAFVGVGMTREVFRYEHPPLGREDAEFYIRTIKQLRMDETDNRPLVETFQWLYKVPEDERNLSLDLIVSDVDELITSILLWLLPNPQLFLISEHYPIPDYPIVHPYSFMPARLANGESINRLGELPPLETLVIRKLGRLGKYEIGVKRLGFLLKRSQKIKNIVFELCYGRYSYCGGENSFQIELSWPALQGVMEINFHGMLCDKLCGQSYFYYVPYTGIGNMLRRCLSLESFIFRPITDYYPDCITPTEFSLAELLNSLLACKDSLKSIELYSSYVKLEPLLDKIHIDPILAQFTRLTTLVLDEQCFCRHWIDVDNGGYTEDNCACLIDILPKTVIKLTIRLHDKYKAVGDVSQFGRREVSVKYPQLQSIRVEVVNDIHEKSKGPPSRSQPLETACPLPDGKLFNIPVKDWDHVLKQLTIDIRRDLSEAFCQSQIILLVEYVKETLFPNYINDRGIYV